jgi:uncharacterized protein YbaR (Trm112 family)
MTPYKVKTFACPIHKTTLVSGLFCSVCEKEYPCVNGVPVLINDADSVFQTCDFVSENAYGGASSYAGVLDRRTGLQRLFAMPFTA